MSAAAERAERARLCVAPFAELYPFEPHGLELEGGWMHYLDEGAREGEVVLALHGNPTWSFYWRALVAALAPTRRVVVPDHLGCGLSDQPRRWRYDLAGHVANLERLVLALGLERITLVLHDWGGAIGMAFAARHAGRVARLVVTNTAAFPGPIPARIRLCRLPLLGPLLVRGLGGFHRAAARMAVERPLDRRVRRALALPYSDWGARIAIERFVRDIPTGPAHPSWPELVLASEGLARFATTPACILWGDRDWCFTPAFRREWQRRLPAAETHVFEDAGHWLLEDAGEAVIERLLDWLARHPLAQPAARP